MNPLLLGPLFEVGSKLLDRLFPDPAEKAKAELEFIKMTQEADTKEIISQLQVNAKEAEHRSLFVAGWRPGVGWTCAAAFAFNFVIGPALSAGLSAFGIPFMMVPLDMNQILPVLMGMLGIGTLRTYEKVKGVTK